MMCRTDSIWERAIRMSSASTAQDPRPVAAKIANEPISASHLGYQPALDGLRAVAVLAVMAYHLGVPGLRGGLLGVDTFFVLSGFLITTLLLQEQQRSGFTDFVAFWARRARRLFPALFLMLAAVCIYAVFATPLEQVTIRGQGLATVFYVNNWWVIISGQSYFNQFQAPSPLIHTWSLGVEEQWYLLFPPLLAGLLAWRLRRNKQLVALLALAALASTAWTVFLANHGASADRLYLGTDTRAQELLVGATLAGALHVAARRGVVLWPDHPRIKRVAGAVGLAAMSFAFIFISDKDRVLFYGGMLAFSVAVAAVILVAVDPDGGPIQRALGTSWLRRVGLISYGLYLWHWPIIVILTPARVGVGGLGLGIIRLALTFAIAIASYRWLEGPIRRGGLKRTFGAQGQVGIAVAAVVVLIVLVVATTARGVAAVAADPGLAPTNNIPVGYAGAGPKVFIIGDSVPYGLRGHFSPETSKISVGGSTQLGCGQFPVTYEIGGSEEESGPKCYEWDKQRRSMLSGASPDLGVLFMGHYQQYDIKVDDKVISFGTPEYEQWLSEQMRAAIDDLRSSSKAVTLVNVPCHRAFDDGQNAKARIMDDDTRVDWLNGAIARIAAADGKVPVIDMHSWACGPGRDPERLNGVTLRVDGLHYSPEGAKLVWKWLQPEFLRVLKSAGIEPDQTPTATASTTLSG